MTTSMWKFPKSLSPARVLPWALTLTIQLLLRHLNVGIYQALEIKTKQKHICIYPSGNSCFLSKSVFLLTKLKIGASCLSLSYILHLIHYQVLLSGTTKKVHQSIHAHASPLPPSWFRSLSSIPSITSIAF